VSAFVPVPSADLSAQPSERNKQSEMMPDATTSEVNTATD